MISQLARKSIWGFVGLLAATCAAAAPAWAGSYTLTTLASFDGTDGKAPQAGLIADAAGNLYGTTSAGGTNSDGTVFEVAAGTHTLTTLA